MKYSKQPISIDEQIDQLEERGLACDDQKYTKHYLINISYYRLAGYWWPMQKDKEEHIFKEGSNFKDVIALYNFDRELRILLFDVIERIEIGLRTRMIYFLSHEHTPWWFQDTSLFIDTQAHIKSLSSIQEEIERSKETFMKAHRKLYKDDGRLPPAWKSLELTSFGTLSKLYGNLRNNIKSKDEIAASLNAVNHTYLPSWLQSIAQIRNICAHHGRLWNKNLPGKVKLLKKPPGNWITKVPTEGEFQNLYIHLCIMKYLLDVISPGHHFGSKLVELFEKYPNVDENALGMKEDWRNEALWKQFSSAD